MGSVFRPETLRSWPIPKFEGPTDDTGYQLAGIRPSTALPVELASFRASREKQAVTLTWTTVSETNNAEFDVQHRGPDASSWSTLGFVDGAGTTDEATTYRYETVSLSPGTHTFRLRQTDVDGTTTHSRTVRVRIRPERGVTLSGPNPVSGGRRPRLAVQVEVKQPVEIGLYDVLGQKVRTIHSGSLAPDDPFQTRLDVSALSSGLYFLRVSGDTMSKVRKISVVR